MTNVPFINKITNELSKRKLKSDVVANALLDISMSNDKLDEVLKIKSSASEIDGSVNRDRQIMVMLGDSITAGNSNEPTIINATYNGQVMWGNALAGSPFEIIYNAGIGGETSSQIYARIDSDVLPYSPSHCIFLCGMNDGVTTDAILLLKNNIIKIYEKLNKNGIFSYICTNTTTNNSTLTNQKALNINAWMFNYFKDKPNCEVIDLNSAWINPANSNGNIKSSCTRDNLHPSNNGGFLGGIQLSKHFSKVKPKAFLPVSAFDSLALNSLSKNILKQPLLLGTTGTLQGTATGSVAADCRVYSSATSCICSKETRNDGFGENQVITVSSAIDAESRLELFSAVPVTINEEFYMVAEIEILSSVGVKTCGMVLFINSNIASSFLTAGAAGTMSALEIPTNGVKMQIKTKSIVARVSSVLGGVFIRIPIYTLANSNATIKIGRVACYRL